jgi:hypothetical protein
MSINLIILFAFTEKLQFLKLSKKSRRRSLILGSMNAVLSDKAIKTVPYLDSTPFN